MLEIYEDNQLRGTPLGAGQTRYYEMAKTLIWGSKSKIFTVKNSETAVPILSAWVIFERKEKPHGFREKVERFASGTLNNPRAIMMDGPSFTNGTWDFANSFERKKGLEEDEAVAILFKELQRAFKREKITSVRMDSVYLDKFQIEQLKQRGLLRNYKIRTWATLIVDLAQDEETIFSNFKPAGRKNVKRCEKENVDVKEAETFGEYKEKFLIPYYYFKGSAELSPEIEKEARTFFENDVEKTDRFYYAERDGEVLATLGLSFAGDTATEIMSSTNPICRELKLPAEDYLHWKLFLEAKSRGYKYFNLAGINPTPQTTKEQGIRRFKEKWGGKYVEYYMLKKDPALRRLFEKVLGMDKSWSKVK